MSLVDQMVIESTLYLVLEDLQDPGLKQPTLEDLQDSDLNQPTLEDLPDLGLNQITLADLPNLGLNQPTLEDLPDSGLNQPTQEVEMASIRLEATVEQTGSLITEVEDHSQLLVIPQTQVLVIVQTVTPIPLVR